MPYRCCAFLLLIMCLSFQTNAQLNGKYIFRHFDQADGLLHTTVNGIAQDERGFIWILTLNGLQRFDGYRFVNYPELTQGAFYVEMDRSKLIIDTIDHYIGVYLFNKMACLDPVLKTSYTLEAFDFLNEKKPVPVLYPARNGELWLVNEYGMIIYQGDTSHVKSSLINPAQYSDLYIFKDPFSNKLFLPIFNDFAVADPDSHTMEFFSDENPQHPFLAQLKAQYGDNLAIRYGMMDSKKNFWVITWYDYLLRYDFNTQQLFSYPLNVIKKRQAKDDKAKLTLLVNVIFEDRQHNIWAGTDYLGLLRFDREKDDFEFITSDEKINNGLRYSFKVQSIFQDRDDNLWIGTDRGINIFNPYHDRFQTIRHLEGVEASLPQHDINDYIETDQGEILVGTWGGGITFYDSQWNFKRNVRFQESELLNLIWSFVQTDDGMIWAGTQGGFIHIYDPVKKSFRTIRPPETGFATIRTMTKDHEGNILLGLHSGKIAVWNKKEEKFFAYNEEVEKVTPIHQPVVEIYVDPQHRCWTSHELGLREFDIEKRAYTAYYPLEDASSPNGRTPNGMTSINDSILVIGTNYGGPLAFNMKTKKYAPFLPGESLDNVSVFAVRNDEAGNTWFSTNFNLYSVSPQKKVMRFKMDKAIAQNALGNSHFYKLSDGRWITSTAAEIICFDPKVLRKSDLNDLKVEISNFKVFEQDIPVDSFIIKNQPLIFPYDKNFFSIEFSALNFMDIRQTDYYYRLSEVDHDWIYSGTRRFADYTDVKPGEYIFQVKADDGNGSSEITTIPIIIRPPWWSTFWFRAVCIFATVSLVYFLFKKRIQTIRKQSALKHRIAETEMMALRSQMNPHFIFNCINSIDAMIQSNDKYRATVYLNKFAKLIRNVLDSSKENKVPLSKDMETLHLYIELELFRHQDKFTATVHADEELMQNDYKVPPLIIQPYVENAILHGLRQRSDHAGKLNVTVTKEADHIVYIIEDNGVGRKTNNGESKRDGQGYGMQMSDDRIRLFNDEEIASVQVTDLKSEGQPSGTRIRVQLKMQ